ncbi:MAG TPA: cupin domain-containing protein [Candidatus Acidoferrales bacterium]|nr:cupin domain-containing protein [Candidatus Acidoferrales bacterium]
MPKRATPRANLVIRPARDLNWKRVLRGAEMAVLGGDPKGAGSLYAIRIRLRDAFVTPPHWHPQDEHVTVLEGTFLLGSGRRFDPRKLLVLRPGTHVVVPKRKPHFSRSRGRTLLEVYGSGPFNTIYVNPEEDPNKKARTLNRGERIATRERNRVSSRANRM